MKLEILNIQGGGDHTKEYVLLKVLAACNLQDHILADTTFGDDGKSNLVRHTFWFPDRVVKKDDRVVIYTKAGKAKLGKTKADHPAHFLYWGLDEAVWNNDGDRAILIEIADSAAYAVAASQ